MVVLWCSEMQEQTLDWLQSETVLPLLENVLSCGNGAIVQWVGLLPCKLVTQV